MSQENELDRAILAARSGTLSQQDLVAQLVHAQIAVPSRTDVEHGIGDVRPILLDKGNATFVAVFTDAAYASAFQHLAGYCLSIDGLAWLRAMPRNVGLVINPGMHAALEISAQGVAQIVRNFSPVPIN